MRLHGQPVVVVHGIVGDLVREEEVPNIYKRLVESLDGQADILVNCAGVQHRCVAEDFPMEEWNRILRVNLGAMFQMSPAGGAGYAAAWIRQHY